MIRIIVMLAGAIALASCAAGPQSCITAHSPSITVTAESGAVITHLPAQTTRVCPAYVTVDALP